MKGFVYFSFFVLLVCIVVACSGETAVPPTTAPTTTPSSTKTTPSNTENMIEPGDMIGTMVVRKVMDESETRPLLPELCGWVELSELSEQKTQECDIHYQQTIFLGKGMFEPDKEKRNENWQNMSWEISINGQPVDLEAFGTIEALDGLWWNILFENPTSDPIEIVTIVTVHKDPVEMYGKTLVLTVSTE